MIHSVTYRHDGACPLPHTELSNCIKQLSKYHESFTRVKVVFYKDNHHQHHDSLITCHLSLYVPNFGSIEIYAHQQDEKQAFHTALHKTKKKLKRLVAKSREFAHHSISMEQLENIA